MGIDLLNSIVISPPFTLAIILCLLSNCLPVLALHVVPGSNCTVLCCSQTGLSNTTIEDVTCNDKDYDSTNVGKAFEKCVACEIGSDSFSPTTVQTDLGWALCTLNRGLTSNSFFL